MWPAATSTTMPSGSFRPSLTMIFRSEPSGFDVKMRPAARSMKNRRPTVLAAGLGARALVFADDIEFFPSLPIASDLLFNFFKTCSSKLVHRNISNEPDAEFHRPDYRSPPSAPHPPGRAPP